MHEVACVWVFASRQGTGFKGWIWIPGAYLEISKVLNSRRFRRCTEGSRGSVYLGFRVEV